jgi:deazaflavin-dependent oxidoreductase (nitroreductase family)
VSNSSADAERAREFNRTIIEEFRANAGRVSGPLADTPLILLRHIGAQSTAEHVTPVAYTLLSDGSYGIAASNGGAADDPDWYHNLVANPRITVEVGAEVVTVLARESVGDAREKLWLTLVDASPTLGEHQRKTSRRFPLLILTRDP